MRGALLTLWLSACAVAAAVPMASAAKPRAAMSPQASAAHKAAAAALVRLPSPATLEYEVSGRARGVPFKTTAHLQWKHDASSYHAAWTVNVPFLGARTQRSEGAVTPAGLAPVRYTESARRERSAQLDAVSGRIHFSSGRPSVAWQAGTQDRLSTSLQLGALLAAAPERYPAGSIITMHTAGVRDAELWQWRVLADETLQLAGRSVPAVHLVRQPRKANDSELHLWLGRTLDYLPVRLRVTDDDGEHADQRLRAWPAIP